MAVRAASQMKTSRIGVPFPYPFQLIRPYLGTEWEGVKSTVGICSRMIFSENRVPLFGIMLFSRPAEFPQSFQQRLAEIASDELDHLPLVLCGETLDPRHHFLAG